MNACVIPPFTRWADIPALPIDRALWSEPCGISAQGQIAWTADGLRVRLEAREAHIRAEETGPLGHPWEDSCLEFFFSPVEGDPRYVNIEFNPNACLCLGIGDGVQRLRTQPEPGLLSPTVFHTPDGWGVEYRVPFDLIALLFPGFTAQPGATLRGNLYKCGDKTLHPHFLAWNPVNSPTPDFHRPQDFGKMILGE